MGRLVLRERKCEEFHTVDIWSEIILNFGKGLCYGVLVVFLSQVNQNILNIGII
jgi:hypothetical protein